MSTRTTANKLLFNAPLFDTRAPVSMVLLPARGYTFQIYSALLSDVAFTVTSDGTVDYEPSLNGVLSGRGTSALRVNGCHVVLDATALSQTGLALLLFNAPLFDTRAPVSMVLLPAHGYTFQIYSALGTVHIAPNYRGIASGDGTPTLRVQGARVFITAEPTIDSLALTNLLGGPVVLQTMRTNEVDLLPVAPGAAYSMTAVSTKTSVFNFNLDLSGNFTFDPSFDGYLHGRGTPSLYVYSDNTASLAFMPGFEDISPDIATDPAGNATAGRTLSRSLNAW